MPFPFIKNKEEDRQKDLALFVLTAVEAINHLPIDNMITEVVERIKAFFKTDYVCIHIDPGLGLNKKIAESGLQSCPALSAPVGMRRKLLEIETVLDRMVMNSSEVVRHNDVLQALDELDQFYSYFEFAEGVSIPLTYQEEVFASINIYHKNAAPLRFADIDFLSIFGPSLYAAIKKEVLIKELADRDGLLEALARTIEASDGYTDGHVYRVMEYSVKLGLFVGLKDEEIRTLKRAAFLHDIGKVGVPDSILNKPGHLTPEERTIIESHTTIAEKIFSTINEGSMKRSLDGIIYHHERVDGKGYPRGLKGTEIPLTARIIAIADTFDALTSDRPYRMARDLNSSIAVLNQAKGSQLDEELVNIFLEEKLYEVILTRETKKAS